MFILEEFLLSNILNIKYLIYIKFWNIVIICVCYFFELMLYVCVWCICIYNLFLWYYVVMILLFLIKIKKKYLIYNIIENGSGLLFVFFLGKNFNNLI